MNEDFLKKIALNQGLELEDWDQFTEIKINFIDFGEDF